MEKKKSKKTTGLKNENQVINLNSENKTSHFTLVSVQGNFREMENILNTVLKNLGSTDLMKDGDSLFTPSDKFEFINSQIPDISCLLKDKSKNMGNTYFQLRKFIPGGTEYLSFCVNEGRECDWDGIVKQFPDTMWLIDNFDVNKDGIFFTDNISYIYNNEFKCETSDNLDELKEKYPIHYGKVWEMELNSVIDNINDEMNRIKEQLGKMKDGTYQSFLNGKMYHLEGLEDEGYSDMKFLRNFWKENWDNYDIWSPLSDFDYTEDVEQINLDKVEDYYSCLELIRNEHPELISNK